MALSGIFSESKNQLLAVVDLGSNSIKSISFENLGTAAGLRILRKKVINLPELTAPPTPFILKIRELASFLAKEDPRRLPQKIFFGLGHNLGKIVFEEWKKKLESGCRVSASELMEILRELRNQNLKTKADTLIFPLEIKVNGYQIGLKNFKTLGPAEIEFRVMSLKVPDWLKQTFEEIRGLFPSSILEIVPLPFTYSYSLASKLETGETLVIDVGKDLTTLSLLKNWILMQSTSFPTGGKNFLGAIAESASVSSAEAEGIKKQYAQGLLNPNMSAKIKDALKKETAEWEKQLIESLKGFYHLSPLPKQIFLTGGGANLPEIKSILSSGYWLKNFSPFQSPDLTILYGHTIFGGESFGGFLRGPEEFGLASLLIYSFEK